MGFLECHPSIADLAKNAEAIAHPLHRSRRRTLSPCWPGSCSLFRAGEGSGVQGLGQACRISSLGCRQLEACAHLFKEGSCTDSARPEVSMAWTLTVTSCVFPWTLSPSHPHRMPFAQCRDTAPQQAASSHLSFVFTDSCSVNTFEDLLSAQPQVWRWAERSDHSICSREPLW